MKSFIFLLLAATAFAAKDTVSFIAVGDIMMGMNYPENEQYLPPQDGKLTFAEVQHILRDADITMGNLEAVLLDSGGNPKKCIDLKYCYTFRTPERYVNLLVDAGFDLVSIANNHSGDFGEPGRKRTQEVLKKAGIGFAGHKETAETYVFEKDGIRYGFVAFAPNTGTVHLHDTARAKQLISELKAKSDIVIVSMHIGAEYVTNITRKYETYIGENRGNPYAFVRMAIDAGADVVFGHGPHVPRAFDLYKGKFIAYSLGNFATNANMRITGLSGHAPIVKIKTDSKGNFIEGELFSVIQQGEKGSRRPFLDPTGACIQNIKELTETDFPETGISINKNGKISLKK
ncbi:MAG: CapA family protein [Fibromonadales bacterium]|nr:CapA family protein [Fibromonadales bacterium]